MIITRFHNVQELKLTIEFLTPTFLGGADQNAELRSAPFKNLLRQWWRVANGNEPAALATKEGELFGAVLGEDKAHASRVRIKVTGSVNTSEEPINLGTMHHPEVKFANGNIDKALYIGYGPITFKKPHRKYITPGSKVSLSVQYPKERKISLFAAMNLIYHFGTIGSRNRNGFGSITITGNDFISSPDIGGQKISIILANQKDYPNSIGLDDNGKLLSWETDEYSKAYDAMSKLAEIYKETRTSLSFPHTRSFEAHKRHILGYPITNHIIQSWGGNNGRMPSQLRLMVKKNVSGNLVGRILHLPHKLPDDKPWPNYLPSQLQVWKEVHKFLDEYPKGSNTKQLRRVEL